VDDPGQRRVNLVLPDVDIGPKESIADFNEPMAVRHGEQFDDPVEKGTPRPSQREDEERGTFALRVNVKLNLASTC